MRTKVLATALCAAWAMASPASAALTIVFEALATPYGSTGGFTAVITNLPIGIGNLTDEHIIECHRDDGEACTYNGLVAYPEGTPIGGVFPDIVLFGNGHGPLFKFANDAIHTPGVHETVAGWINVGRLTVSGTLDGPPIVYPVPGGGHVPEPTTWALLILGFGLAGGALRGRRASACL
jgi:hypothetical protein